MRPFHRFLEQRESPILFIDLDGTLVHTSFRPNWAELLVSPQFRQKSDHFAALREIRMKFSCLTLEEQLKVMGSLGGTPVSHGDIQAVTFLRPGAKDFLVECMGIARTCIITQGKHRFQKLVVDALDIPVKDLYGNLADEEVNYGSKIPQSPAAILVDDMPRESALVKRKLKAIGLDEETERFIKVTGWEYHKDNDDYPAVLKKIRELVKK
jgi:hypothetical protein